MLSQFGTGAVRNLLKIDQKSTFYIIRTLSRTFSVSSIAGPLCRSCIHQVVTYSSQPSKKLSFSPFQRNTMYACHHILSRYESILQPQRSMIQAGIISGYNCFDYCNSINRLLLGQKSLRMRQALYVRSVANNNSWRHGQCMGQSTKFFQVSHALPYSVGAATDISFYGAPQDDQLDDSNRKFPAERSLKLFSGSCYLPHPDKEETGGEDAHFICDDEQAIGVADGVGGWADHGINAGHFARELMFNSVSAIQYEPQGLIDPTRVLENAYLKTKAMGSSTACIIALTDQGIHAVNLGDSGFRVVRDGSTIFRSPTQQHDFNFPYQLASEDGGDLPRSGQVFNFHVESGDVIVAGTDGLFDNLYNDDINAIVVHGTRTRSGPQVTAQRIAALARQRALDKNRQTPFSTAAQDVGIRYFGGKLDDITVVVSFITSSLANKA